METNNKKLMEELEQLMISGDFKYKATAELGDGIVRYVDIKYRTIEAILDKLKQLEQIYNQ